MCAIARQAASQPRLAANMRNCSSSGSLLASMLLCSLLACHLSHSLTPFTCHESYPEELRARAALLGGSALAAAHASRPHLDAKLPGCQLRAPQRAATLLALPQTAFTSFTEMAAAAASRWGPGKALRTPLHCPRHCCFAFESV